MKYYNHNFSKTILARSFNLSQLLEDDGENIKKISYYFFLSYCPLQIWTFKFCNNDISKIYKLGGSSLVSW